jgi:hypothetical protein
MRVNLTVDMDNAMFDHNEADELAGLLESLAEKVRCNWGSNLISGPLTDDNGCVIGRFEVSE